MNPPSRFARLTPYAAGPVRITRYQIPAEEIGHLTSLLEANGGMSLARTLDQHRGVVECWTPPDQVERFDALMTALAREFPIKPLDGPLD